MVLLIVHWINLSKKKSEIERLEVALQEIKNLIPKERKISFQTNLTENSPQLELYFQTQFVMCPIILSERNQDTILIVEKIDKDFLKIEPGEIITSSKQFEFKITLLRKSKI